MCNHNLCTPSLSPLLYCQLTAQANYSDSVIKLYCGMPHNFFGRINSTSHPLSIALLC